MFGAINCLWENRNMFGAINCHGMDIFMFGVKNSFWVENMAINSDVLKDCEIIAMNRNIIWNIDIRWT
jgi:hypothetical protein